jgi:hypothetical protein
MLTTTVRLLLLPVRVSYKVVTLTLNLKFSLTVKVTVNSKPYC